MEISSAKVLSAVSSALALAVILPGIVNSSPVLAQSGAIKVSATSTPANTIAQRSQKLSSEQRQQIRNLRQERNAKIASTLDKKQASQFTQAINSHKRLKKALEGLNLTSNQQQQIKSIMATYRDKMKAVINQ
ncbi:hypothetical protein G7B40_025755 [Aetokthonos hydrillicola Thurmond2011]|jgi:Spy/CpxP family protein refolding chaperone|uniref:Uncharacterized protein n=1 Tax=Aetokthonos hydrillicola Thurmond2011 TaxID=2712845 RepID=A0AAP5IAJ1_9CYAN|nr:hypothetical protein [Aetokthonos hydrillicola]MBO3460678.1 hypothetical protein [Aetokthonos hydrillicola CCALA 1050]MBW4587676.1 hypothetical protein [Aetokthonos hydrillicola CCALA 1050]MDR9897941.1 hypothetical protein [Aetokthonos hydrillicola Thurmond2011]